AGGVGFAVEVLRGQLLGAGEQRLGRRAAPAFLGREAVEHPAHPFVLVLAAEPGGQEHDRLVAVSVSGNRTPATRTATDLDCLGGHILHVSRDGRNSPEGETCLCWSDD